MYTYRRSLWHTIPSVFVAVHASGLVVLKMLVRTDVAEALNISVGDVTIRDVLPVGYHALSIDVDTTFKVEVSNDAEPEEVHRKLEYTLLHGDDAVSQLANEPDRVFNRTTRATHTKAKVSNSTALCKYLCRFCVKIAKDSKKLRESRPDDVGNAETEFMSPIIGICCLIIIVCSFFAYARIRKNRARTKHSKSLTWYAFCMIHICGGDGTILFYSRTVLGESSESSSGREMEERTPPIRSVR